MPRSSALLMLALLLPLAAQAKITIDIPEATEQVATNVRAFLSLTRYADRDDITPETMSRLHRRIVSETRAALATGASAEARWSATCLRQCRRCARDARSG